MKKDIRYIAETKEFIIDGVVVKESSLTESELKLLKEQATNNNLLIGSTKSEGSLIV